MELQGYSPVGVSALGTVDHDIHMSSRILKMSCSMECIYRYYRRFGYFGVCIRFRLGTVMGYQHLVGGKMDELEVLS